ncbi:hypothetical protein [Flavobacterium olei]
MAYFSDVLTSFSFVAESWHIAFLQNKNSAKLGPPEFRFESEMEMET